MRNRKLLEPLLSGSISAMLSACQHPRFAAGEAIVWDSYQPSTARAKLVCWSAVGAIGEQTLAGPPAPIDGVLPLLAITIWAGLWLFVLNMELPSGFR